MPRDGSGVYQTPPGTDGITDAVIASLPYNVNVHDIEQDLNVPRPIVAGGTGGTSPATARTNLQAEVSSVQVTNYGSHVWESGSFWSDTSATGAPHTGNFTGTCVVIPGFGGGYIDLEAMDNATGVVYVKRKVAGSWSGWQNAGSALVGPVSINGPVVGTLADYTLAVGVPDQNSWGFVVNNLTFGNTLTSGVYITQGNTGYMSLGANNHENMRLDDDGSVTIMEGDPVASLTVRVPDQGSWGYLINNLTYGSLPTQGVYFSQANAGYASIGVNNHESMRLNVDGSVLISSASPDASLIVQVPDQNSWGLQINNLTYGSAATQGIFLTQGNTGYGSIGCNNHEHMRLNNDGAVLVTAASPDSSLIVQVPDQNSWGVQINNLTYGSAATQGIFLTQANSGYGSLGVNNQENMRFLPSGAVSITGGADSSLQIGIPNAASWGVILNNLIYGNTDIKGFYLTQGDTGYGSLGANNWENLRLQADGSVAVQSPNAGATYALNVSMANENSYGLLINNRTWGTTPAKGFFIAQVNNGDVSFGNTDTGCLVISATTATLTTLQSTVCGAGANAPTGGAKGPGTLNAKAVYDDNVLLTCFGTQYAARGAVDLAQWDQASPTGKHKLAHKFVDMLKDFDPRDPMQYVARMLRDEALPGMPTPAEWQHGELSAGEMINRLWLAVELLAAAFAGAQKK